MKKLFITLFIILLLIAGAAVVVSVMYPMSEIEKVIKAEASKATGREVDFSSVGFNVFPSVGLRVFDLSVGNPEWAKSKNMLEVEAFDINLALRPLFDKHVEVKRFVLIKPIINLEKSKTGRVNWELPALSKESSGLAAKEPDAQVIAVSDFDFKFSTFKLNKGSLSYNDHSAEVQDIKDIDVVVVFPSLESSLQLDGALDYRGERIALIADLKSPMALIDDLPSDGDVHVKTGNVDFKLSGKFMDNKYLFLGDMSAAVKSLPDMLVWLAGDNKDVPFTKLSFKSATAIGKSEVSLSGATLTLDEIEATGGVSVQTKTESGLPFIKSELAINHINLDRFMPPAEEGSNVEPAAPAKSAAGWDATPMSFSALNGVDFDVTLKTKGFSLKGAEVGASEIKAQLGGGSLHAGTTEASLFGGVFSSDLRFKAWSDPTMSFAFEMKGVQAKPVLKTFAGFEKLSGATDANITVGSIGNSQKAIIENMQGSGSVVFKNGALEGIDLVNIAKALQSRLNNMGVGGGKTDFVELGGTFTVAKGVAINKDFSMKGPLVQAVGAGSIDLPRKYINYRVNPKLTASSAEAGASGLGIPVDIKGPFANIKIKPDYASIVKDIISDPQKIEGTIKGIRDQAKGMKDVIKGIGSGGGFGGLGGLFGAPQQPAPAE